MYKTLIFDRETYFDGRQLEYYETDNNFISAMENHLYAISADNEIISVQFFDDINRRPYKCMITYKEKIV